MHRLVEKFTYLRSYNVRLFLNICKSQFEPFHTLLHETIISFFQIMLKVESLIFDLTQISIIGEFIKFIKNTSGSYGRMHQDPSCSSFISEIDTDYSAL